MYDLGLRIKETRIRRRLSQKELAEKINNGLMPIIGKEFWIRSLTMQNMTIPTCLNPLMKSSILHIVIKIP